MKTRSFAVLGFLSLIALGCTKAVPDFSNLDSSLIPQPLIFGQTRYTLPTNSPSLTYVFSGTCDKRTKFLEVRESGSSSWYTIDSAQFLVSGSNSDNCGSAQTFSLTVSDMTTLNGGSSPSGPMQKEFEIRSQFEIGPSNASVFIARYSTTIQVKPGQFRLTQGTQDASGSQFKVNARVSPVSGGVTTGSQFRISR